MDTDCREPQAAAVKQRSPDPFEPALPASLLPQRVLHVTTQGWGRALSVMLEEEKKKP